MVKVLSFAKIWDGAKHNAFTDLIFYKDRFLCAFRESNSHAGGKDGKIRILASQDARAWSSVALISLQSVDLRDPMLSEMPDGRLLLSMGGSLYDKGKPKGRSPRAAFSDNGSDWSKVYTIDLPEEWIWRITWHEGIGYGGSYRNKSADKKGILTLFKTTDGLQYTPLTCLDVPNPSEATLRFQADGTMVALVRRGGPGWIGSAKPPYTEWNWSETEYRLGGPNFLILPNGTMWAGSRLLRYKKKKLCTYTALVKMSLKDYAPYLVLESGGDTSYPGMVYRNNVLHMSYYSSHEGKAMIYFVCLDLEKGPCGI